MESPLLYCCVLMVVFVNFLPWSTLRPYLTKYNRVARDACVESSAAKDLLPREEDASNRTTGNSRGLGSEAREKRKK